MAKVEQKTIGIAGAASGAGVTHLVMALANYSVSHKRRKTAVVELSGNHSFEKMTGVCEPFEWNRIICYPNLAKARIADIISGDYEVVIFDMGSSYYRIRAELLRCNRKLVLGSLAPWRKQEYVNFVVETMGEDRFTRDTTFYTQSGNKKDKKEFNQLVGRPVYPIPYLPEPLQAKMSQSDFMEELLL